MCTSKLIFKFSILKCRSLGDFLAHEKRIYFCSYLGLPLATENKSVIIYLTGYNFRPVFYIIGLNPPKLLRSKYVDIPYV